MNRIKSHYSPPTPGWLTFKKTELPPHKFVRSFLSGIGCHCSSLHPALKYQKIPPKIGTTVLYLPRIITLSLTVTIFYTTIPTKHQALFRPKNQFLMLSLLIQVQKPNLLSVQTFYGVANLQIPPRATPSSLKLFPMAVSKQEPIKRVYFIKLEDVQGETVLWTPPHLIH